MVRAERYTYGAITFHWVIATFIVLNLALGFFHETLLDGIAWVIPLHKSVGITIIALTLGRIGWRIAHPAPALPPTLGAWERLLAHGVHILLYGLMLILPLSGWLFASSSHKYPLLWFGLVRVPFLPVTAALADQAYSAHVALAWILIGLLVLHTAGALRHHLRGDATLARMIPSLRRRD